jgi:general secretion pathway protein N
MNAVGQQRLTPWLVGACAVTGAALLVLFAGVGRHAAWNDVPGPQEEAHATRSTVVTRETMPLTSFAEVWQRPLFAADRKPGPVATADAVSLGDLQLTGIILTPGLKMALLRSSSGDKQVRVKEGAALPDGRWTLATLGPRSATFDNGGERKELTLVTARPDALAKPETNNAEAQRPANPGVAVDNGTDARIVQNPAQPTPPGDDPGSEAAQRRARIDALRAAVQRRRAEQQATQQQQAPEGVR